MQTRETARTIKDRPNYFHLEIGDLGRHDFRLPNPLHASNLMQMMEDSGIFRFAGEDKEALREELAGDKEALSKAMGLMAMYGAAVGLCWYHETEDLETPIPPPAQGCDLSAYGAAVLSELHDADYMYGDLRAIFPDVIGKVVRSLTVGAEEASDRADFSPEQTEDSDSS